MRKRNLVLVGFVLSIVFALPLIIVSGEEEPGKDKCLRKVEEQEAMFFWVGTDEEEPGWETICWQNGPCDPHGYEHGFYCYNYKPNETALSCSTWWMCEVEP